MELDVDVEGDVVRGQLPGSVRATLLLQAVLVLVAGVMTLMTVVLREELLDDWARRHPTGIEAPAFVPVAVVMFVTFALLAAVLLAFFRGGHPSARAALTVLAVFHLFAMLVLVRQDPPVVFSVLAVLSGVLEVALLVALWHRDTSAFVRGPVVRA